MFAFVQELMWSLPIVGLPFHCGYISALVGYYIALGALSTCLTQPKPLRLVHHDKRRPPPLHAGLWPP